MAFIRGTSGNDNPLNGTSGDDRIDGLAGADVMVGGTGNDVYYVENPGDQAIEAVGEGTDTVYSTIDYTLGADEEIKYLRSYGSTAGLILTGNGFDNSIFGTSGSDTLAGGGGSDRL